MTKKQKQTLRKEPNRYVMLHNHPKGFPPSNADFNVLAQRKQKEGYIICHDGRLYHYGITENFVEIPDFTIDKQVEKYLDKDYNKYSEEVKITKQIEAQVAALNNIKDTFGFYFEEVEA